MCSSIVNLVCSKLTIAYSVGGVAWLLEVRFRNQIWAAIWAILFVLCCVGDSIYDELITLTGESSSVCVCVRACVRV